MLLNWRRLLRVRWTARRWNQSVLKEINPEYSLEGLMLKLQYFDNLMWRANSLGKTLILGKIKGKRRRRWQRMRWLDSIMDMNLRELWQRVKDREAWHAVVHGVSKSQTELSDWTQCLWIFYHPFLGLWRQCMYSKFLHCGNMFCMGDAMLCLQSQHPQFCRCTPFPNTWISLQSFYHFLPLFPDSLVNLSPLAPGTQRARRNLSPHFEQPTSINVNFRCASQTMVVSRCMTVLI